MTSKQKNNIRHFKGPVPVREIGLVTYRYFLKDKLIACLKQEILSSIPAEMKKAGHKEIINLN
jgi:LysR family transcriptional regulator, hydrogen peroxide-inducible genes activator